MDETLELATGELVDRIVGLLRRTNTMPQKTALVHSHSGGRHTHVKEMVFADARLLELNLLELDGQMNKMRRRLIAMAHQIGWKIAGENKADIERLDRWCTTYAAASLNKMTKDELSKAITAFEQMFRKEMSKTRR